MATDEASPAPPGELRGGRRIAMVLPRSDVIAGASVHIAQVCDALDARGNTCRVFVGGDGSFSTHLRDRGIRVESVAGLGREIRPHNDLIALVDLARRLGRFRPDLVAAHTAKAGVLARIIGRLRGYPVIYTPHGWAFFDGVPRRSAAIYLAIERMMARFGGPTIAVSDYERAFGLARGVGTPEQIVTIPNGIADVGPEHLAEPGDSPPELVMVARFDPQKNQSLVVEALDRIRHLDWSMTFVGAGDQLEEVRSITRRLGLESRVSFPGQSDDVPPLLAASQVFILSSNWESYPYAVLEAMRAGLPCVVSDVGGAREMVIDGSTGRLVPRGDVGAMADALGALVADPGLRTAWGRAGRRTFLERHTDGAMIDRTIEAYDVCIRAHRAS